MKCIRCEELVCLDAAGLPSNQIQPGMEGTHCSACGICVGLKYGGVWISVQDCLVDASQRDGWIMVEGLRDRAIHWVLSQIVYRICEPPDEKRNETAFDVPDPTDIVYLLWVGGYAVGFCTLKPKGILIERTYERYSMTTVDTVFVRSSHRRRGHVTNLLQVLSDRYQEVGFSQPISNSMTIVLFKFLNNNVNCRRRFWEISEAGSEGFKKLVWFMLRKTIRSDIFSAVTQSNKTLISSHLQNCV